jgi:hypothetical protein
MTTWQQYAAGAQLLAELYGDAIPPPGTPVKPLSPPGPRWYTKTEADRILNAARRTSADARTRALAARVDRLEHPPAEEPAPAEAGPATIETPEAQPVDAAWMVRRWRDAGWSS